MNILHSLNSEQRRAVEHIAGPLIINAGPGTGKTKTLISRIIHLTQNKDVPPSRILALTFTKKAAAEMQERLEQSLVSHTQKPLITTFHALGYDILSSLKKETSIITETERVELLRELCSHPELVFFKKANIRELSLMISKHKSQIKQILTGQQVKNDNGEILFLQKYNEALGQRNLCDYDDLILQTYQLLSQDNQLQKSLQEKFQFILVDEFQDTNDLQYQLLKLLLSSEQNLFVIGDPFQSIYSFRGADSSIFQKMKQDFPKHTEISLLYNYRSTKHIVEVSSRLFPSEINLTPIKEEEGTVHLVETMNEYTEADYIVREIGRKIGGMDLIQAGDVKTEENKTVCFNDFAIIYRTHFLGKIIQQKLHDSGIPYQVVGSDSVYETSDVIFIISLLKYLTDKDDESFKQILFSAESKVDKPILSVIKMIHRDDNITWFESSFKALQQNFISTSQQKKLSEFLHKFEAISTELNKSPKKLSQTVSVISSIFEIEETHLNEFISELIRFDQYEDGINRFLEYVEYLSAHDYYDEKAEKVTLLTMHASKGLEFAYIFITAFEEGRMPYNSHTEEEKRLLYVAMTRAKKELYLLYTRQRERKAVFISPFHALIESSELKKVADEAIAVLEKKQKKWQDKKSQMELF